MPSPNRPLSPFMLGSTYKLQMSSVSSLFHRVTGVALAFSFFLLVLWVMGAATGGGFGKFTNWLITSWFGKIVLLLSLWAIWYHLINGIRHIAWDLGYGFDIETAKRTGWVSFIGSVVMTVLTLILL